MGPDSGWLPVGRKEGGKAEDEGQIKLDGWWMGFFPKKQEKGRGFRGVQEMVRGSSGE